jgi:hypothetical protein
MIKENEKDIKDVAKLMKENWKADQNRLSMERDIILRGSGILSTLRSQS